MNYVNAEVFNVPQLRKLNRYMRGHNGFIAGGCFKNLLCNTEMKDVDVFFEKESDWADADNYFKESEDYGIWYENSKVTAYKNKETGVVVELIRSTFGTPEQIIDKFDFSIVKFAYSKHENDDETISYKAIHHPDFYEHLFFKRLVVGKEIFFPASTFERVLKYAKYGFSPCRETKINVINSLREIQGDLMITESLYDGWD